MVIRNNPDPGVFTGWDLFWSMFPEWVQAVILGGAIVFGAVILAIIIFEVVFTIMGVGYILGILEYQKGTKIENAARYTVFYVLTVVAGLAALYIIGKVAMVLI